MRKIINYLKRALYQTGFAYLTLMLVGATDLGDLGFANNKSDEQENVTKELELEQEVVYSEIPLMAKTKYNYYSNLVELSSIKTVDSNADDEIFEVEEIPENINTLVEIKYLLEKNNLTSDDLMNLLYTSRYQNASNDFFARFSGLDANKILGLLEGNQIILRDNLFLGDSRTKGMLLSGVVDEENTVYGVGYGYNWLIGNGKFSSSKTNALNGGIDGLERKMEENNDYNIVMWLGVNDYTYVSANTYYQKFVELATDRWSNHNIYIVSVGPVNDSLINTVSNEGINSFNTYLKELINNSKINNLTYIDLNLGQDFIKKYDNAGLHYGSSDYEEIYSLVVKAIAEDDLENSNDILNFLYSVLLDYDKINTVIDYVVNSNLMR